MGAFELNYTKLIALATIVFGLAGCENWMDTPFEDRPENLSFGVITVSIRPSVGEEPNLSLDKAHQEVLDAHQLWNTQCGISIEHSAHLVVTADGQEILSETQDRGETHDLMSYFYDPHYFKAVFVNSIGVANGYEEAATGGIAGYPGDEWATLLAKSWTGDFVLAHELGHQLGLGHAEDGPGVTASNLMFPVYNGAPSPKLLPEQCAIAKEHLLGHASLSELCRPGSKTASGPEFCTRSPSERVETTETAASELTAPTPLEPRRPFRCAHDAHHDNSAD